MNPGTELLDRMLILLRVLPEATEPALDLPAGQLAAIEQRLASGRATYQACRICTGPPATVMLLVEATEWSGHKRRWLGACPRCTRKLQQLEDNWPPRELVSQRLAVLGAEGRLPPWA